MLMQKLSPLFSFLRIPLLQRKARYFVHLMTDRTLFTVYMQAEICLIFTLPTMFSAAAREKDMKNRSLDAYMRCFQ